ncbi:flagellar biosynthetic protein FliO [Agathobacter sp.]|uniref:flagellar biosynthetic protein FliO n=1 Tax=Agathobacter sp. TaxID=2021311 RepID=UPI0006904C9D|nr:flagellar biosynthetic protein FliO [Agathobacter sp.]
MNILLHAKNSSLDSVLELIGVLFIFLFVVVITWLTTKWMANYQKAHINTKNLNLVETIRVGNNKTVSILKAGKKYYVISNGKETISLIGELTEEDLEDLSFKNPGNQSTKESFTSMLSKFKSIAPVKDKDEQN